MWRNTSFSVPPVNLPFSSAVQPCALPLNFKSLERVRFAVLSSTNIPPPLPVVLLSVMVHSLRVNVEFWNVRPPPMLSFPVALLPLMVQSVIEPVASPPMNMPPPSPSHVLLLMTVLFSIFSVLCRSVIYKPPPKVVTEVFVPL